MAYPLPNHNSRVHLSCKNDSTLCKKFCHLANVKTQSCLSSLLVWPLPPPYPAYSVDMNVRAIVLSSASIQ